MPGSFHGINLTSNALAAFQQALDVTGHNISNVNTPGYTRQAVDFVQLQAISTSGLHALSIGNGVSISSVNRVQDVFLAARMTGTQSDLGKSATMSGNLQQVESLMNDTSGNGISDALDGFFNAWSALASNPNDAGLKTQVQLASSTLTLRVRNTYSDLANYTTQINGEVGQAIQDIDGLTTKIADLNSQIRLQVSAGVQPNDLLDQRDQAVNKLSSLVGIHVTNLKDGSVSINMDQTTLVDQSGARPFPTSYDASAGTVTDANGTYNVTNGQLAGLFQSINTISGYQSQLDTLANTLRTQVNTVHQTGINSAGATGLNFFNDSIPQSGAIDFDLNPAILANSQAIATGASGNAGDGGLALSLSQLRGSSLPALGNETFGQFYTNFVGQVGRDSAYYKSSMDTQVAVAQQIGSQIQSVSGVSLDDEMANMLRFQRSYQAAARALSIFDQTTQDLINILR